jgi:hypothetical protein
MKLILLSLCAMASGCLQDVAGHECLVKTIGIRRTTTPPGFDQKVYAFALCIKNTSPHPVRSIRIKYDRLQLERWHFLKTPSVPPKGWKPKEKWNPGHLLYANAVIPPGTTIWLIGRRGTDVVTKVRIRSIELDKAAFTKPDPPLFKMAKEELKSEGKDPLIHIFELMERQSQIHERLKKEDPEALAKMLSEDEIWVEATLAATLDKTSLKLLIEEADGEKWRGDAWDYVDVPVETGREDTK